MDPWILDAGSLVQPVGDMVQLAADVEEKRVSLSIVPVYDRVVPGADDLVALFPFLLDGSQGLKQAVHIGIQPSRLLSMAID